MSNEEPRIVRDAMRELNRMALFGFLLVLMAAVDACGSDHDASLEGSPARVVDLPGAEDAIDFDDIVYSSRLRRIIVPARRSGLYLIDPRTVDAARLGRLESADSADEGAGRIFVVERERRTITALDPRSGHAAFSFTTEMPVDYVRYVAPTRELWLTEPAASPSGIEVFALAADVDSPPQRVGFVAVRGGPEALTVSGELRTAFTHAGADLVAINVDTRRVTGRWPAGCAGTHGFPQVDARRRVALASCSADATVSLLSLDDGRQLGRYAAGGGEALPGHSRTAGHFYVRGDPGTRLVTLAASKRGLTEVAQVPVPSVGHCLTADEVGHYWTCDAEHGRVLRFDDR